MKWKKFILFLLGTPNSKTIEPIKEKKVIPEKRDENISDSIEATFDDPLKPCIFEIGSSRTGLFFISCKTHGNYDDNKSEGAALQQICFDKLVKKFNQILK